MTAIYTTTHKGLTASRKSAGHVEQQYFFAIWVQGKSGGCSCEAYTSRIDLAQARAREFGRCSWVGKVTIEPVTAVIKLTKKQQIWAAAKEAQNRADDYLTACQEKI